ncbi:MAG: hypothetical protein P4N59_00745 [Negativicutes bacterium]|nr:hypothetical protein [Negativicutes bacterium]
MLLQQIGKGTSIPGPGCTRLLVLYSQAHRINSVIYKTDIAGAVGS